ncbi:MAG TPA: response regulator [Kofleriaceae bacterium]
MATPILSTVCSRKRSRNVSRFPRTACAFSTTVPPTGVAHLVLATHPMQRNLRALIADDDPDTLRMVGDAVEELGTLVTRVESGGELLERLANDAYDVVVTDVSMPWMTGLQAAHSARTAGLATPIVVITALRDEKIARQVEALGHDATLLYKPFGIDQLHAAIGRVLRGAG